MLPLWAQVAEPNKFADFIDQLARTPLSKVIIFVSVCTVLRIAIAPYLQGVPKHLRGGSGVRAAKFFNEALDALVYAGVFVFLLIRPYCIQAFKIPSGSMLDTLQINDFIVANKAIYRFTEPKHGDIIVFRPPKRAILDEKNFDSDGEVNVDYIKRCIGLPGDIVEIKNGDLYRNGQKVVEPYLKKTINNWLPEKAPCDFKLVKYKDQYWPVQTTADLVNAESLENGVAKDYQLNNSNEMELVRNLPPVPIPKGFLLMVGDNRSQSFDGRCWGLVPREDVIGRAEVIWMPMSRWRSVRDATDQK